MLADWLAVNPQQPLIDARPTVGPLGHQQDLIWHDRERPQIECLVMQRAECQAVVIDVEAAGLVPLDVGRFEADRLVA